MNFKFLVEFITPNLSEKPEYILDLIDLFGCYKYIENQKIQFKLFEMFIGRFFTKLDIYPKILENEKNNSMVMNIKKH